MFLFDFFLLFLSLVLFFAPSYFDCVNFRIFFTSCLNLWAVCYWRPSKFGDGVCSLFRVRCLGRFLRDGTTMSCFMNMINFIC